MLPGSRNRVEGREVLGCGRPGSFQLEQGPLLGRLDALGTFNKGNGKRAQPLRRRPVKGGKFRRHPGSGGSRCNPQVNFHFIQQRAPGTACGLVWIMQCQGSRP